MNRWLISPPALEYLPVLIWHLVILGYLFSRKDKSKLTWLLTGWLCGLTMLMLSCFAGHAIYAPLGGYIFWIGGMVSALFALNLELQFAYRFPRPGYGREARRLLVVSGAVALGIISLAIAEAITSLTLPAYNFGQFLYGFFNPTGNFQITSATLFNIAHLAGRLWVFIVWLRKTIRLAMIAQPAAPRWRRTAAFLWRPPNKEARVARNFTLLMATALLAALVEIGESLALLPAGSFFTLYSLTLFGIVLTYADNAPEPSTFMAKLVGISLVTLLIILGLVNPLALRAERAAYHKARHSELAHIKTLLDVRELTQIPPEVLYIAARTADGGLFADAYHLLFSRVADLSAETFVQQDAHSRRGITQDIASARINVQGENPWLSLAELDSYAHLTIPEGAPAYRGAYAAPAQHYIRYTFASPDGAALYEVGYSYLSYRRILHEKSRPFVYLTIGATLLMLFVFPRFFQISLVQPLNRLLAGVAQVDAGDLSVTVPVRVVDEIGFLTNAFNKMVDSLRLEIAERRRAESEIRALNITLEQRVTARTRELSALYEVSAAASQSLDLDALLAESLARSITVLHGAAGAIFLVNDAAPTLQLAAHQNIPPELLAQAQTISTTAGVLAEVIARGEPVLIPDITTDARLPAFAPRHEPLTLIAAPLRADGQVVGILSILRAAGHTFTLDEVALLAAIADQVGIAVKNDRLRRLAQRAMVFAERQRLARDLHDSVIQSLYGLLMLSETEQARLAAGERDTVEHTLARLTATMRQAIKEMRLFIYQLRPPQLDELGLRGALQHRLAAVEGRAGVETQLSVDTALALPAAVEQALYQIAQEALNNVLKHARATIVTVRLRGEEARAILEIADNGCGFDVRAVRAGGLGLTSMRERAAQLDAALEINSALGAGTRVTVIVRLI